MTRRLGLFGCAWLALAWTASPMTAAPTPVITEPAFDGQVISAYDVHMVAAFSDETQEAHHVCSDWEIRTIYSDQAVWTASCVTGTLKVHIHLGDGQFVGLLEGRHELNAGGQYKLRVRFLGDADPPGSDWSAWAERLFVTTPANAIQPLILSDVSETPAPRWRDDSGQDLVLPAGSPSAVLHLEVPGTGTLLELARGDDDSGYRVANPPALSTHGPMHVYCGSGGAALSLPASYVAFTDGSGQDREVALPPIALSPGQAAGFWIDDAGDAFAADAVPAMAAAPDFTTQVAAARIPWAVRQPGYRIERFATGFQLPVNIAFLTNPGPGTEDPFLYVTELYGTVRMVTRGGVISSFATGLLNFDPTGPFPGSGEKGLAGIVVDATSGDVFVSAVEAVPPVTDFHYPRVIRLHSSDGGLTAASRSTILDLPNEPVGPSHQISNLSIGPDGKLYVHIGDGTLTTPAEDLTSARGKILRINLDGSAPLDNPFYDAADGISTTDLIYAYGFRNPFGGAWRALDGAHWEVENGPNWDRLAKIVAGRNYMWDGTNESMATFAAYVWKPSTAPVNIAFVQSSTFSGSGFPAEKMDHAFVTESGPTYAPGPQELGKRISEFVLDAGGNLVADPLPLVEYIGAGRATAAALAAGPDGLYFSGLYKDFGAASGVEPGATIFRVRYTGIADFTADAPEIIAGTAVTFKDRSDVPAAAAWHWDFGDGTESDERNPVHEYNYGGTFDVRLTVAGAGGDAVHQKPGFVVVQPAARPVTRVGLPGEATQVLQSRP
jgi:glucose/arabinose dehydrogenase